MMEKALMFGAGNIGRGFIGQLFSESSYEVVFVDIDDRIIAKMNQEQAYTIRLVDNTGETDLRICPVCAFHSSETDRIADLFCEIDIGATAVGARVLPFIAPLVAKGIEARIERGIATPVNLIICENLKGAAAHFRRLVAEHLKDAGLEYLDKYVGLVDTVIGRMVPPLTPAMREEDPTLVLVEPYKHLPVAQSMFVGDIPIVQSMEPKEHFEAYTAVKLFIHNCSHATLSYLGFQKGFTYGFEALEDREIEACVRGVMKESINAISIIYGEKKEILQEMADDLLWRFHNRALGDTIFRLGRDPIRKLGPDDRLVGAARLVEQAEGMPVVLAKAIAAGYCFNPVDDSIAVNLQEKINKNGIEATLYEISGIRASEPLGIAVLNEYGRLQK